MASFYRVLALGAGLIAALPAQAQLAVSANDGKVSLVDGAVVPVKAGIDTITILDLASLPPKRVADLRIPTTVVGPPTSVAITPNGELALVTAGYSYDAADHTKQIFLNKVTVVSLKGTPSVLATLSAGMGAAGVSINKAGTLALVANREEGTVSVFSINGTKVEPVGEKVSLGDAKIGPSGVVFTPDGKTALVTLDGEVGHRIAILSIDGTKVTFTRRAMNAGLRPYGIDMSSKGDVAVVANIGRGGGDDDTISVIDLAAKPMRVVYTVTVGQTPEGIKMSHDGKLVAVTVMNGSNKPTTNPFYNAKGKLVIYRLNGTKLSKYAEAPVGRWCQGIAWSRDNARLLAQCAGDGEILGFSLKASS